MLTSTYRCAAYGTSRAQGIMMFIRIRKAILKRISRYKGLVRPVYREPLKGLVRAVYREPLKGLVRPVYREPLYDLCIPVCNCISVSN